MSLVALDGSPLVAIGQPYVRNSEGLPSISAVTQDAANEACIQYGYIVTADGASHTINTTGSSAIGFNLGTLTFANAGSTFKVGLATLDATTGPAARATNVADVITFSVSKSYTGGGGVLLAGAWNSAVPNAGSLTVANGDYIAFCTQMTALGGADSIITNASSTTQIPRPGITGFTGGAYAASGGVPNAVITFSDGTLGWFYGGAVWETSSTTQTWNNTSGTKEYGNYFQMPFPVKIYGILAACNVAGDTSMILYSDPLGTPVAERTVAADLNQQSNAGLARFAPYLFATPYSSTSSQPLAAIMKPTSATNVASPYKTFASAAHQATEMCGTNGYAINRNTGAFAAQNSNRDRFAIGLLVGAFEAGGTSGPAGKLVSVARGSPY